MYIGEASRLAGVSVKAIRHYEAIGLLPCAQRIGSYRVFNQQDITFIRLIRQAQQLGFTLAEMKQLREGDDAGLTWQRILQLIDAKQAALQDELARLEQQRASLDRYREDIVACLAGNPDCEVT